MATLTIFNAEGEQQRKLLPHNTLGRHPENTMQILDRIISKEHCHIDFKDGRWVLRDLGSLNGTFVNGERVSERELHTGDEIVLGSTRARFEDETVESGVTGNQGVPKITVDDNNVDSHIRTRIGMVVDQNFVDEKQISSVEALREDYEKLRVSYEFTRMVAGELEVSKLLEKILDCAFELLNADRGVILMYDEEGQLRTNCVRAQRGSAENVSISRTILSEVLNNKQAVLSSDASMDSRFQGAHSVIMQGIRSTMAVPLLHAEELFGIMFLDSQIATNAFAEKDLQLLQTIANQAAIAIQNSLYAQKLEREAVTRERFRRLLSPAIAAQVIEGKLEVKKGGELRETTILFSDIRGFTAISERFDAPGLTRFMNRYLTPMT
ncbi:MAG: FHA domain-containing protein, partial [Myxococcales bacterium]|nr:FHA domain-containing protein [Myxococcales bacterium]